MTVSTKDQYFFGGCAYWWVNFYFVGVVGGGVCSCFSARDYIGAGEE